MGLINIYDTVSNEHKTIHANGKLKDILPECNFEKTIFIKAGEKINSNYRVKEEDVLYARVIPGSTAVIAAVAIVTAVVAVGVGVGSAVYAKKQSDIAKAEMEKAQKDAENLAAATQQLPFIRGAKNQNALGKTVQLPMGSVYNTPYNITGGFYSIDGLDGINSYYNATFSLGFGEQKVTELMLGNERIASDSNGISGVKEFDSDSIYYENNSNSVEVRHPGSELSLNNCNQKVNSSFVGAELKHEYHQDAEPVILQCADNAMTVQVCVQFSCLRSYDSDQSDWVAREAKVSPYWSNDGGQTWNLFQFAGMTNNTISRNVNRTIRFVATKTFSPSETLGKHISIKIIKDTEKAQSGSQEDCSVLWFQTFCYDPETSDSRTLQPCKPLLPELYNKTTRVAYRITSSESTDGVLDELHAYAESFAPVWSGTSWGAKEPTRNPASWIYEILTSDYHKASKISVDEIDRVSLGRLYEYCETNNFYCDGIVTQPIKKLDLISKILSTVNADMIINSDGKYEFVIDKEEDTPVALLNAENIKSITYSKDLSRKTDGSKVTFNNRDTWNVDTFYSMLDGGSFDWQNDVVEDFACEFVTTYEHAYKMAQRKQRQQQLQTRTIKADVGNEGDYYPLYSTVLLQLPQLMQGLNSSVITNYTVENGYITKINISDLVEFFDTSRYGIIISACNTWGNNIVSTEVTGSGKTRELVLSTPIDVNNSYVSIGNHLSFGLLDNNGRFTKITNTMKICGIEPGENDGYVLTLKDYNEEMYSYGGPIPAYKSNLTKKQVGDRTVTINDINKLRQDMNVLQEDLIRAYQVLEMPIVVDADVKSFIIEIDEDGNSASVQTIVTQVTCRQGDENRNFAIGNIELPEGWTYSVESGRITFIVGEGVKVKSGQFRIPVIYRPATGYIQYEDENGELYVDESNESYMEVIMSESTYTYDIWFTYFGLGNGVYLGMIRSLEDIPVMPNLNDYFTWGGPDQTPSALSIENVFREARVYKYIGVNKAWKWEVDTNAGHSQAALSDVLSIANADLQNNNSTAWEYLYHLTANSIYTDLLVANSAYIDKLMAKVVNAGLVTTGTLDDAIVSSRLRSEQEAINKLGLNTTISEGQVIITGGTILADYINVGTLKVENAKYADNSGNTGTVQGYTLIQGGQIDASLINTAAIKATAGFFDGITVNGFLTSNTVPFQPIAVLNIGYNDGIIQMTYNKNVREVTRDEEGVYTVYFNNPVRLKTHIWNGAHYIDVIATGNAHDNFGGGFNDQLLISINWVRNAVDGLLEIDNLGYASVSWCKLYFSTGDDLYDPISAQIFMFATETN